MVDEIRSRCERATYSGRYIKSMDPIPNGDDSKFLETVNDYKLDAPLDPSKFSMVDFRKAFKQFLSTHTVSRQYIFQVLISAAMRLCSMIIFICYCRLKSVV